MGKYRVKRGQHNEGGKNYSAGEIVDSPSNLSKIFPGKFEEVSGGSPRAKKKAAPKPKPKKEETANETKEVPSPYGEDVTGLFKTAEENGLKVFKKRNWFTVVDNGEALNEKGLKAEAVESWISDYFEEAEGE